MTACDAHRPEKVFFVITSVAKDLSNYLSKNQDDQKKIPHPVIIFICYASEVDAFAAWSNTCYHARKPPQ